MNPERRILIRAIKASGLILVSLVLASCLVAGWVGGAEAAWAALAGVGVAAFVGMSTQVALLVGSHLSPTALVGIILGSFVVKAVVLLLILWGVSGSEMPRGAFVIPLLIGAVAILVIDTVVVVGARIPIVAPEGGDEAG